MHFDSVHITMRTKQTFLQMARLWASLRLFEAILVSILPVFLTASIRYFHDRILVSISYVVTAAV